MNEQQEDEGACICGDPTPHAPIYPLCHPMTTVQQGSDESGEGLARDLTYAILAHYGYLPEEIARAEAVHPGRVCDDDECWDEDGRSIHGRVHTELHRTASIVVDVVAPFFESAEAALATARRDADELRGRLAAVEALADEWTRHLTNEHFAPARLRAALANPSADMAHNGAISDTSDPSMSLIANPSAAQGEGEVGK